MDKICHLCGTAYNDDPYFQEQPAHPPEKCIDLLRFRLSQAELTLGKVRQYLIRARNEYHLEEK